MTLGLDDNGMTIDAAIMAVYGMLLCHNVAWYRLPQAAHSAAHALHM